MKATAVSLLLVAACTAGSDRTSVPSNDLGASTIETERGDGIFELRAFDRDENVVANVRVHTGQFADLTDYIPNATIGSEIEVTATGHDPRRLVTSETQLFMIDAGDDPAIRQFLLLDAVRSALRDEGNLQVMGTPPTEAYEYPPTTYNCPAGYLVNNRWADQCCYTPAYWSPYYGYQRSNTYFVNVATNQITLRWQSDYGACKGADGSYCTGDACFYGPNGFSRPYFSASYANVKIRTYFGYGAQGCISQADYGAYEFPGLWGSFPAGQSCPGGLKSYPPPWDY